jgi:small subunit ribosomal protein S20
MTHSKQAAKRVRQNLRLRQKNRAIRSAVKSAVRAAVAAPTAEQRVALAREAVSKTDKAVKYGVIHKNAAARRKSRLQKALNRIEGGK